jgi:hypothetical protein
MVDDTAKEVDRIMKKLNRLQFDLQNKKAALSEEPGLSGSFTAENRCTHPKTLARNASEPAAGDGDSKDGSTGNKGSKGKGG